MHAPQLSALLLAGVLLLHVCSAAPEPAKTKVPKAKPFVAMRHQHIPRMDVQQQKTQSLLQEKRGKASAQQVVPLVPLSPDCVPKYVTDLVVPPPMPVAAPVATQVSCRVLTHRQSIAGARRDRRVGAQRCPRNLSGLAGCEHLLLFTV